MFGGHTHLLGIRSLLLAFAFKLLGGIKATSSLELRARMVLSLRETLLLPMSHELFQAVCELQGLSPRCFQGVPVRASGSLLSEYAGQHSAGEPGSPLSSPVARCCFTPSSSPSGPTAPCCLMSNHLKVIHIFPLEFCSCMQDRKSSPCDSVLVRSGWTLTLLPIG